MKTLLLLTIFLCLALALGAAVIDLAARQLAGAVGPSLESTLRASTACIGALNLGSCNVRQETSQVVAPAQPSALDKLAPWFVLGLLGGIAGMLSFWLAAMLGIFDARKV